MRKINVGIIGFGLSGKVFHSSLLKSNQNYDIKKVFSTRIKEVNSFLPNALVVNNCEKIFKDTEIELVIICGPNSTHFEHCKNALTHNKHVVVEKPFVTSTVHGKDLIALAHEKNKILSVFHNRRWDADFLTIKSLIDEGRLGNIKQFESHFDRLRPNIREGKWKEVPGDGTGILFDLGSHLIDQALCLFGTPDAVLGDIVDQKENQGVDDYFHIILKYGRKRVILHSTSFSNETSRFLILGDKGSYIKFGLDPQERALENTMDPNDKNFGIEDSKFYGKLSLNNPEGIKHEIVPSVPGRYITFYEELAKAIKNNDYDLNPVNAESALEVIKIIEAVKASSAERKWITT